MLVAGCLLHWSYLRTEAVLGQSVAGAVAVGLY